jgi:hypothetical protein
MYRNRITSGPGMLIVSECTSVPSSSMISALSESTKHTARRAETTLSGSYVAFNTSALRISYALKSRRRIDVPVLCQSFDHSK